METVYELTKEEREVTHAIHSRFEQARADMIGLQASMNNIALLIAKQQGLTKTAKDTVQFDASFTRITVSAGEDK